jgi:hypothetical protein
MIGNEAEETGIVLNIHEDHSTRGIPMSNAQRPVFELSVYFNSELSLVVPLTPPGMTPSLDVTKERLSLRLLGDPPTMATFGHEGRGQHVAYYLGKAQDESLGCEGTSFDYQRRTVTVFDTQGQVVSRTEYPPGDWFDGTEKDVP